MTIQQNLPTLPPAEMFAIEFATLAREIAMDIFELPDILRMHRVTDEEWERISTHPKFTQMLGEMIRDWNGASNTKERVRVKAATGLESVLENYIREINDADIPLTQRVEAGKFLARLGELDGQVIGGGQAGGGVTINISTTPSMPPLQLTVEQTPVIDGEFESAETVAYDPPDEFEDEDA